MRVSGYTAIVLAFVPAFLATTANATAQRTFVASYGVDTNACSLNAPCRSFGAAIVQTNDGGEIIVLDSAGYGRVTVDKSVTIMAPPGVYAGISVFPGTNGVDVDAAAIEVVLRGLSINGQGGVAGIRFQQGSRLTIERCTVRGMLSNGVYAVAAGGQLRISDSEFVGNQNWGIDVVGVDTSIDASRVEANAPGGVRSRDSGLFNLTRSLVRNNTDKGVQLDYMVVPGSGYSFVAIADTVITTNGGRAIFVNNTVAQIVKASLDRVSMMQNGDGLIVIAPSAGSRTDITMNAGASTNRTSGIGASGQDGLIFVHVRGADIGNNPLHGVIAVVAPGGSGFTTVITSNSQVNGNSNCGIFLSGANAGAVVSATTISHNNVGACGDGVLRSAGNNVIRFNNAADVSGPTAIPFVLN